MAALYIVKSHITVGITVEVSPISCKKPFVCCMIDEKISQPQKKFIIEQYFTASFIKIIKLFKQTFTKTKISFFRNLFYERLIFVSTVRTGRSSGLLAYEDVVMIQHHKATVCVFSQF